MSTQPTVLLVGGSGRTGGRVLRQLVQRGAAVRAIVRSRAKLPAELAANPRVTLIEASLLALSDDELRRHVRGCDAVVSCLGHTISLRGIFGAPRDLVTRATARLCQAIAANAPAAPVRYLLMSSVSVERPRRLDSRRTALERAFLWLLCRLLPPAKDNQRAADYLIEGLGQNHPFIEWVAVRPDALQEGEVSEYAVHEGLVDSVFSPGKTNMANVAHFFCELLTDAEAWRTWRGKLPVVVNSQSSATT
jgi:nucleoside-diphosphate-sugar epimerase